MRILEFGGFLGLGGTEKAMCSWSTKLKSRGHEVIVLAMRDGTRKAELQRAGIEVVICDWKVSTVTKLLLDVRPDVIHSHSPGTPAEADVVGEAARRALDIPLVETNIFGRLQNPSDRWTNFRLFISWTSCVQAVRRSFRKLDETFFRYASVATYPIDPVSAPTENEIVFFRRQLGIEEHDILFGRLSRPEPNKWTDLALQGFRRAASTNQRIKLLLREPPSQVTRDLQSAPDRDRFVILPATANEKELTLTLAGLDAVLHTSIIGESFGYGIAEPMNLGKPVIANSTPWGDQAQIELVRHGECGFIASTPETISAAILALADNGELRARLGQAAQAHIRELAAPERSLDRLETALRLAISREPNPHAEEDLATARRAARYLDANQLGHSAREWWALGPKYYWSRLHQLRAVLAERRARADNRRD
ncbi:MAG TPA: glycosyltransferase family 4 protein [Chthoniobacterales bacterium]|jgi:glycosyltransferase involved in cell wall biosynthesis